MIMLIVIVMGVLALIAIDRQHALMERRLRARARTDRDGARGRRR